MTERQSLKDKTIEVLSNDNGAVPVALILSLLASLKTKQKPNAQQISDLMGIVERPKSNNTKRALAGLTGIALAGLFLTPTAIALQKDALLGEEMAVSTDEAQATVEFEPIKELHFLEAEIALRGIKVEHQPTVFGVDVPQTTSRFVLDGAISQMQIFIDGNVKKEIDPKAETVTYYISPEMLGSIVLNSPIYSKSHIEGDWFAGIARILENVFNDNNEELKNLDDEEFKKAIEKIIQQDITVEDKLKRILELYTTTFVADECGLANFEEIASEGTKSLQEYFKGTLEGTNLEGYEVIIDFPTKKQMETQIGELPTQYTNNGLDLAQTIRTMLASENLELIPPTDSNIGSCQVVGNENEINRNSEDSV